jgi:lipid-A-disaccharide synthase
MSRVPGSVLIVAGEESGDLHASKVAARLRELAPGLELFGVGGDRMGAAGVDLAFHSDGFAMVGLVEVLRHVPRLRRAMDRLVGLAVERRTSVAILVDYPGFNLILAKRLRDAGVRVLYYISPQVWAWGEGRVRKIAGRVDRMAVVLPFEEQFYRDRGIDAAFVGHPLLEEPEIAAASGARESSGRPCLGLLPGSRTQEVERLLPHMMGAVAELKRDLPDLRVRLGRAPGIDEGLLTRCGNPASAGVEIVPAEERYDVMRTSTALLISSGTATLEAACFGTPMVVVYRLAAASYLAGRALVKIPDIGLVNVVAGERIVPELIQGDATAGRMAAEVRPFLVDDSLSGAVSRRLLEVRESLGRPGASDRVAHMVLDMAGGGR